MKSELVQIARNWELPALMGLGGTACLFFGLFQNLPAPGNGWTPSLREPLSWPLLVVGGLLVLLGVWVQVSKAATGRRRDRAAKSPEEFKNPHDHPIVSQYHRLTNTQKELVIFRYEDCSTTDSISVDELFERYTRKETKYPVGNVDELYYRLKDLNHVGLVRLKGMASHATSVRKIRAVSHALARAEVIVTGV